MTGKTAVITGGLRIALICTFLIGTAVTAAAGGIPPAEELHTYSANIPGDERILIASGKNYVIIYDLRTEQTAAWLPQDGTVAAVAVNTEGSRIAIATQLGSEPVSGYLGAWTLPDGTYQAAIPTPGSDGVAFLGDDLLFSRFNSLRLWSFDRNGTPGTVSKIYDGEAPIVSVKTRGGQLLLGLNDGSTYLLDRKNKPIVIAGSGIDIADVAVSPMGSHFAAGDIEGNLRVWSRSKTSVPLWEAGDLGGLTSLDFGPADNLLAFANDNAELGIFSVDDGRLIWSHRSNTENVEDTEMSGYASVRFTEDGNRLIAARVDNSFEIFLLDREGKGAPAGHLEPAAFVTSVTFSAGGERVTGDSSGAVKVARSGKRGATRELYKGHSPIMSLAFGPEGDLLIGELNGRGVIYRAPGLRREGGSFEIDTIRHTAWFGDMAVLAGGESLESPNGIVAAFQGDKLWTADREMDGALTSTLVIGDTLVTGSLDGALRLYRPFESSAPIASVNTGSAVNALLEAPDGAILALNDISGIVRYSWNGINLVQEERVSAVQAPQKAGAVDMHHGRLAIADFTGGLWIYDYSTMEMLREMHFPSQVTAMAFEPGTHNLHLFLADGTSKIMDLE